MDPSSSPLPLSLFLSLSFLFFFFLFFSLSLFLFFFLFSYLLLLVFFFYHHTIYMYNIMKWGENISIKNLSSNTNLSMINIIKIFFLIFINKSQSLLIRIDLSWVHWLFYWSQLTIFKAHRSWIYRSSI